MTFTTMFENRMMANGASASFAEANDSCAHTASMQSANSITMTMDAIILASIIISLALLGVVSLLGVLSARLVLVVLVVLVNAYLYMPDARKSAYL